MVRKTSLAIDQELLTQVREILGTHTVRETVEQAFLEIIRAQARHREVEAMSAMRGLELDDPEVMAGAWRR